MAENALNKYIRTSDKKKVKELLNSGIDPNLVPEETWGPLHLAVVKKDTDLVDLLIGKGADVNLSIGEEKNSPLIYACQRGFYDEMLLLLKGGANSNYENIYGLTPLIFACYSGEDRLVTVLLRYGANINLSSPEVSPLLIAVYRGDENMVKLLLNNGADASYLSTTGLDPVLLAVLKEKVNIVRDLLTYWPYFSIDDPIYEGDRSIRDIFHDHLENEKLERVFDELRPRK